MNILTPYLAWIKAGLGIALMVGLLAALQWFRVHEQNIGRAEVTAQWNAAALKAEQAARVKEQAMQSQLQKATDEHQQRETALVQDVATTRATADSLRNQLAASRRDLSSATADAARQYATALSDVFAECTDRLTELAKAADGHASDSLMYQQAWPK